jgi:hypothetical protein
MHHIIAAVFAGSIFGGAASSQRVKVRSALRQVIKGGIVAKRKMEAFGAATMAETHKLVDEAQAELGNEATEHKS